MIRQTLLLFIIVLNFADVATTLYGLNLGGTELNPLFRLEDLPMKIALPFAYGLLFILSYDFSMKQGFKKGLRILNANLIVLVIVYVVVVANNLIQIARALL